MDKLIKYCNTGDIIPDESFRSLALIFLSPAALLVLKPRIHGDNPILGDLL